MKCDYCGAKLEIGSKFYNEQKLGKSFCTISHLRNWIYRHTGSKYFKYIIDTVKE